MSGFRCPADKRSRHLGADGIYLDDITELEPEVAALYFPKRCVGGSDTDISNNAIEIFESILTIIPPALCSDGGPAVRSISDPGVRSTSLSPQSLSSGGDSGVDSYCDPITDLPSIAISLCGGLTDNREITKGNLLVL